MDESFAHNPRGGRPRLSRDRYFIWLNFVHEIVHVSLVNIGE